MERSAQLEGGRTQGKGIGATERHNSAVRTEGNDVNKVPEAVVQIYKLTSDKTTTDDHASPADDGKGHWAWRESVKK